MHRIALPLPLDEPQMNERRLARARYAAKQILIIGVAVALAVVLAIAVRAGLARNGIAFDMGFLFRPANFDISEGVLPTLEGWRQFASSDTNGQALLAGFLNTLKTSAVGIVLATVLGVLWGVARVSRNWLLRQVSFGIVEFIRNTPLLIQLVFWYFAVVLKMPALTDASSILGAIFSQQGIFLPGVSISVEASHAAVWTLVIAMVFAAGALAHKRGRYWLLAISALSLTGCAVLGFPLAWSQPTVTDFAVSGGFVLSPEFAALVLALSIYTAAFIAEIVRGAILALPRGQWEAASALGLNRRITFVEIVIPQVLRVVLPSFSNQYISLVKSSSLGIAIGFPDIFNVYGTVANQSGRNLEGVLVVMMSYLILSWTISAATNFANSRLLTAGGQR